MKQIIVIFSLLLFAAGTGKVCGQIYLSGQKGLEAKAGAVDGFRRHAFSLTLGLSQYTPKANRWIFGVEYLQKNFAYGKVWIPVEQFTGEGGYYLNFLSDRSKTVFFSAGVSAMAGYEAVFRNNRKLYDGAGLKNKSAFVYGVTPGLEMEVFIIDRMALLIGVRERILFGTSINTFHCQIEAGIKVIIN